MTLWGGWQDHHVIFFREDQQKNVNKKENHIHFFVYAQDKFQVSVCLSSSYICLSNQINTYFIR